ncbi:HlyD family type I secretion periplasmic adaptor subunit [Microvirga flavescens]|uniref:HlyD family type I secretion periplasmic adaptor subunit n=1 Tax=Microvirga flavescens TaxID=2249811 RepID=UPI000DD5F75D|nr:HlyD family type I secretion periplasmic adaptor subunit [Microvirga flavescens]
MAKSTSLLSEAMSSYSDSAIGPAVVGGAAALALLLAVAGWSSVMSVASAAITSGRVTVEGNRKAIQHREGGSIGTVFVREGQLVEKGQKLLQLDLADAKAEADVLSSGRDAALFRTARLQAERAEATQIAIPQQLLERRNEPQIQMMQQQETALLNARLSAYLGQISLLKQQIEGSRRQIAGIHGRVKAAQIQLDSVDDELASLRPLQERGLIARPRTLALERTAAALHGDIEALNGLISAENDKISAAEIQITQLTKERLEGIAKEGAENDARLAEIEPRLVWALRRIEQSIIVAPEAGYVYGLAVFGPGAALTPGQTALEIVPANDQMVVSVDIEPTDIKRVQPGQSASIHFLPYRQRYQKAITGKLEKVSADLFEEKGTNKTFYKGVIRVQQKDLDANGVTLTPGMPAQVTIETGKRTILAYFLDPVFKIYDFALKEQ